MQNSSIIPIRDVSFPGEHGGNAGDTFINGDDSTGVSTSFPAKQADSSASHRNTAHVAHASRL